MTAGRVGVVTLSMNGVGSSIERRPPSCSSSRPELSINQVLRVSENGRNLRKENVQRSSARSSTSDNDVPNPIASLLNFNAASCESELLSACMEDVGIPIVVSEDTSTVEVKDDVADTGRSTFSSL